MAVRYLGRRHSVDYLTNKALDVSKSTVAMQNPSLYFVVISGP